MRKSISTLLCAGLFVVTLGAIAPVASAETGTTAPVASALDTVAPSVSVAPATVAARHFTATGDLGRYYTKQTVTGTYLNGRGRPMNVTVYDWQGIALVVTAKPQLDKAWWGNYWHKTYGLDQWYVGTSDAGTMYYLMLPPAPMGSTFTALLVSDFGSWGNWQNWMDGSST